MVIVVTAVGVRKVVEKWLCENMTCELVVSRNARHECCVEVIYDSGNPSVLRTLLRSAVGEECFSNVIQEFRGVVTGSCGRAGRT